MDINTYKRIHSVNGETRRERIIAKDKRDIRSKIIASPDYKQVEVENSDITELVVHTTATESVKNFNTMPDDVIHLGDIVLMKGIHWLVIKIDYDDDICMSGEMEQCNRLLPFQNKITHEIVKKWCIITKPYSSNLTKDYEIATSSREYKVKIKYDEDTKLVDVDDRFLLETINGEPKSYIVTGIDQQTNIFEDIEGGFLIWNVKQDDGYTPERDNATLMIADYVEPKTAEPPQGNSSCQICYKGDPVIRVGGSKKLSAQFTVIEDAVLDDIPVQWNFDCDDTLKKHVSLKSDNNTITVTLDDNFSNETKVAGQTIKIICFNEEHAIYQEQTLKVVVGF